MLEGETKISSSFALKSGRTRASVITEFETLLKRENGLLVLTFSPFCFAVRVKLPEEMLNGNVRYLINPTGRFVVGGPHGDAGLTGRKIIVDTYGGMARHGGGAFSGKDPSKVDRSAAYMARYIAKNIVAAGLCTRCEVQLAYAIGVAEPVSLLINSFGTAKVPEDTIGTAVRRHFDLTPSGIIDSLDLRRPIFRKTATYGHFGRDEFSWEQTNATEGLIDHLK